MVVVVVVVVDAAYDESRCGASGVNTRGRCWPSNIIYTFLYIDGNSGVFLRPPRSVIYLTCTYCDFAHFPIQTSNAQVYIRIYDQSIHQ
jgi:hypothetical protein